MLENRFIHDTNRFFKLLSIDQEALSDQRQSLHKPVCPRKHAAQLAQCNMRSAAAASHRLQAQNARRLLHKHERRRERAAQEAHLGRDQREPLAHTWLILLQPDTAQTPSR